MQVKNVTNFTKISLKDMLIVLLYFANFLCAIIPSTANDPEGFLSIDCGYTGMDYRDPQTNLTWTNDRSYIQVGETGSIPSSISSHVDIDKVLKTFRYFPSSMPKYCYELPTPSDYTSFLIRATFFHANSSALLSDGTSYNIIQFSIYINATEWITVQYNYGDDYDFSLTEPVVREGIFLNNRGTMVNVCLVPSTVSVSGTPFISSLELRKLGSEGSMYIDAFVDSNRWGYGNFLLSTLVRWNAGLPNAPLVRYPNDTYDRFWESTDDLLDVSVQSSSPQYFNTKNTITSRRSLIPFNSLPYEVMEDSWSVGRGVQITVKNLPLDELLPPLYYSSTPDDNLACVIFYVYSNESRAQSPVPLNVTINQKTQTFNITDQITMKSISYAVSGDSTSIAFRSPPEKQLQLMALEVYRQVQLLTIRINARDENIMQYLKKTFNKVDWQGDPCSPVPYDGVYCGSDESDEDILNIATLDLSNLDDSRSLVLPSNRSTTWDLPLQLTELSITNSSLLDDNTIEYLLSTFTNSSLLEYLDLTNNNLEDLSCTRLWKVNRTDVFKVDNLYSLDLSYNRLTKLPFLPGHNNTQDFLNTTLCGNISMLSSLILSHNLLHEFPSREELELFFPKQSSPWLHKLDISNNNITGYFPVGSFEYLFSLEQFGSLDISNNSITGSLPDSLLEKLLNSTLPSSLVADNNTISGTLNMAAWFQRLLNLSRNSTIDKSDPIFHQLFSFVNNDISSITPSAKHFESLDMNKFLLIFLEVQQQQVSYVGFGGGILLGGNPYCKNAKTNFSSFLCRSSYTDGHYGGFYSKKNIPILPIIGGVFGGNLVLFGGLMILAIIWRLRKQVVILREFQQELLSRNVKPPFFSYNELKTATNDFHIANKLGSGAFGAVYKGILPNQTEVAVKKLFNSSQQAQVLSDFLNEVVLLTGIKHKNLVQLLGCCINDNERILVYEFAERGNVADSLWGADVAVQENPMSWEKRLNICLGVARGLSYLHEELQPRIIHRDVKAANVLIDRNYNPKMADFGLAIPFQQEATRAQFSRIAGTMGYVAPEYMDGLLTEKADVYSFGILVLEILYSKPSIDPNRLPEEMSLKYYAELSQKQGNLLQLLQPELHEKSPHNEVIRVIEIALMCLDKEPRRRPTMSQIVIMLAGITEDALFLSLSKQRESFDETPFHSAAQNENQNDSFIELTSYPSWPKDSARVERNIGACIEEEALMHYAGQESSISFSMTSYDEGSSTSSSGRPMMSFQKSISAKSLGR